MLPKVTSGIKVFKGLLQGLSPAAIRLHVASIKLLSSKDEALIKSEVAWEGLAGVGTTVPFIETIINLYSVVYFPEPVYLCNQRCMMCDRIVLDENRLKVSAFKFSI